MTKSYLKTNYDIWNENVSTKNYKASNSLPSNSEVVIVGGGIAGVIAAYMLSKSNKKVVLLEKAKLGQGATAVTTAFLTQIIDTDATDLISARGSKEARSIFLSHHKAIDEIEKIIKTEQINCEFTRCSNYIYTNNKDHLKDLEEEYNALKKLGLNVVFRKGNKMEFNSLAHIEVKNQAKFHPFKFLQALAFIAEQNGAKIIENTEVKKIKDHSMVCTNKGNVKAEWIIINTYEPYNKPLGLYFKKAFYTSYVLELQMKENKLKSGTYEDTLNPYHYFRVDEKKGNIRVIIGGEDHRSDIKVSKTKNFQALEEYAKETFKGMKYKIIRKWYGPILEPIDGLAYIGPLKKDPNILYSMAFSGNGMTYSMISALIHKETIKGKKSSWQDLYPASRVAKGAKLLALKGRDYTEEFIKGALKNSLTYSKKKKK